MEVKVRFKNKISEPLYKATDFAIKTKSWKNKTWHCLEFNVCKSMGISETYSFDSHDKRLLEDLLERIKAKNEFIFDEDCKICEKTIRCTELDYDKYLEMLQTCKFESDKFKFAGGDYVIIV